jgi:hypothetical protein
VPVLGGLRDWNVALERTPLIVCFIAGTDPIQGAIGTIALIHGNMKGEKTQASLVEPFPPYSRIALNHRIPRRIDHGEPILSDLSGCSRVLHGRE